MGRRVVGGWWVELMSTDLVIKDGQRREGTQRPNAHDTGDDSSAIRLRTLAWTMHDGKVTVKGDDRDCSNAHHDVRALHYGHYFA